MKRTFKLDKATLYYGTRSYGIDNYDGGVNLPETLLVAADCDIPAEEIANVMGIRAGGHNLKADVAQLNEAISFEISKDKTINIGSNLYIAGNGWSVQYKEVKAPGITSLADITSRIS